jgi:hypothetical protein
MKRIRLTARVPFSIRYADPVYAALGKPVRVQARCVAFWRLERLTFAAELLRFS